MDTLTMSGARTSVARGVVVLLLLALGVVVPAAPVWPAPGDVGLRGPSYGTATTAPTADKPQSKLWFNAGSWWGSLFSRPTLTFTIHRLDQATQTWIDTGVVVDARRNAKVDALWDGTHLTIAAAGPSATNATDSIRITRYSFSGGRYSRDPGYPVNVVSGGSESVVVDRDTTGTLWVTWTRSNRVYVSHSTVSDASWVAPYVLPVAGAGDVSADDLSSIVAFGGKIGVLFGNQNASSPSGNSYWFAVHRDGTDDSAGSWTVELAYGGDRGTENADDHLNIKSLQSDDEGRIFASVKTSLNDSDDPLNVLLVRDPSGVWDRDNVMGRVSESHTRAIVLLDDSNDMAHVFAASPCCSGGVVHHKKVSFQALAQGNPFASGLGAPFIRSATDPKINNPTSTKQTVNDSTGLVVLASDDSTRYYLFGTANLTDPETVVPDTSIGSGPSGEVGGTSAAFTFSSDAATATFECRLDGGAFTACTSPAEYADLPVGPHTFAVRAVTPGGTDASPASRTWTIVEGLPLVLGPAADAAVRQSVPSANDGAGTNLLADASPVEQSYLRFDVTGAAGRTVTSAVLRLYVTNGTGNGPALHTTQDVSWDERQITWSTKPALSATPLLNKGSVPVKTWIEYDVTTVVTGDGPVGFALVADSSDGLVANSKEAATNRPQLVVTTDSAATVDTIPPETMITSAPTGTVSTPDAQIAFSSSESATFACRLDDAAFAPCTSPTSYTGLADGTHTVEVQATDTAGNTDPTPATANWTVSTQAPPPSGVSFRDDFENGAFTAWSAVTTDGDGAAVVQGDVVRAGTQAARLSATANTGSRAHVRRTLDAGVRELAVALDVQVAAEGASGGNVPLVRLFDDQGARVLTVYRQNLSADRLYVNYDGSYLLMAVPLPLATWARLELRVRLGTGGTGVVEVLLNGQMVHSRSTATVATALRTVQIGNETARQAFVLYADDVSVTGPEG